MTTKVEKTIVVDVPVSTAYNQWTQFEEFPEFMGGVKQVTQLDDQRLHWVAEIAGVKREWDARILEQVPDHKIAWAATTGATNAGAVHFASAGAGQTTVTLSLEYQPEGLVEKVGDKLNIVEKQAQSDLEKFKTFIEGRGTESGGWRGSSNEGATGTPGVDAAASSQGDSGKVGLSAKTVAAGAAVAAAGIAAAGALKAKSGSDTEPDTVTVPPAGRGSETTSETTISETTTAYPAQTAYPVTPEPSAHTEAGTVTVTGIDPAEETGVGFTPGEYRGDVTTDVDDVRNDGHGL